MHSSVLLLSASSCSRVVRRSVVSVVMLLLVLTFANASAQDTAAVSAKAASATVAAEYGRLPLSFEPVAKGSSSSEFISRGAGYRLLLSSSESVLRLGKGVDASSVRMQLVGGNLRPEVSREDELPGKSNYLIGKDPRKWRTNVPNYGSVRYKNVYRGIDLVYYGNQRRLEHDFVLAPGADPGKIRIRLSGARKLALEKGDLVIHTSAGELRLVEPDIYQLVDNKRQKVAGGYVLLGGNTVGFKIAPFDRRRQLVIDPVLSYSSYLGGGGYDFGYGIAVDSSGSTYVVGSTNSTNFEPAAGKCIGPTDGCTHTNVFVTKLSPDGKSAIYSTMFGGTNDDVGLGIAVRNGNAYVTGYTSSVDFPIENAYQTKKRADNLPPEVKKLKADSYNTAFVAELNTNGSGLVYSTYLGGNIGYEKQETIINDDKTETVITYDVVGDYGQGIAVDSSGRIYVAGATACSDFPTTTDPKALSKDLGPKAYHGFVAKIDPVAIGIHTLVYSTYLGGTGDDYASGIAVDSDNNIYVAGTTGSTDFPIQNAFQDHNNGRPVTKDGITTIANNAFITKIQADGLALVYSTYLGGSDGDSGESIAVESGRAYIAGTTASTDFPLRNPIVTQHEPVHDPATGLNATAGFVTQLAADGQSLVYSTYVGNGNGDFVHGIALDSGGDAFIVGDATSSGHRSAFVKRLAGNGQAVTDSMPSFLTGNDGDDYGHGIAVDSNSNAYVTGYTTSTNFPTYDAVQPHYGGLDDAFVAKIIEPATPWLWVSPSKLTFTAMVSGGNPPSQAIHILNCGVGTLSWTASSDSSWLIVSSSGTATSCEGGSDLSLSVNASAAGVGSHTGVITVTADDAGGSPSTVEVTLTVNKIPTVTTLQTSASTAKLRDNVSFTAKVTSGSGTPTGTVALMDGTTKILEATLNATTGTVDFPSISTLSLGTHNITAVYAGDSQFAPSTSAPVAETITGSPSATTLQTSSASVLLLNSVSLSAHVTSTGAGTPTGTVTFAEGTTTLGNAVLAPSGAAVLTISTLGLGSHDITASYSGDSNFGGSTSSAITQTVQDFQFGTGGSSSTLTATVQAGGTAHYQIQLNPVSGATFPSAITFTVSGLPAGASYTVTPSSIAAGAQGQSVAVDVRTSTLNLSAELKKSLNGTLLALALLPVLGLAWKGPLTGRRSRSAILLLVLLAIAILGVSCSSSSSSNPTPTPNPQSYTMQLHATSGALTHATQLVLTVR